MSWWNIDNGSVLDAYNMGALTNTSEADQKRRAAEAPDPIKATAALASVPAAILTTAPAALVDMARTGNYREGTATAGRGMDTVTNNLAAAGKLFAKGANKTAKDVEGFVNGRPIEAEIAKKNALDSAVEGSEANVPSNKQTTKTLNPVTTKDMNLEYDKQLIIEKTKNNLSIANHLDNMKLDNASYEDTLKYINDNVKDPAEKAKMIEKANQMYPKREVGQFELVRDPEIEQTRDQVKKFANPEADRKDENLRNPLQTGEAAMGKAASNVVARMETPENWYESDSFRVGLIRFGLGLLSGEDLATSFSGATASYSDFSGREKRESYRQEMIDDGFEPYEIEQWVQDGKTKPRQLATPTKATASYIPETRNGVLGQTNVVTNQWTPYAEHAQKASVSASGQPIAGGPPDELTGNYGNNAQVSMAAKTARVALESYNNEFGNVTEDTIGDYPLAGTMGNIRTSVGTKDFWGRMINSGDASQARSAEQSFLNSYMRLLSGGAITDEEWYSAGQQLFPRGDDDALALTRKAFMRDYLAKSMEGLVYNQSYNAEAGNYGMDKTTANSTLMGAISNAAAVAGSLDDYDPQSGIYFLKDGSMYDPKTGEIRKAQ